VLLCRQLQKNTAYYYNPRHFVSVSSMAYRMKRNGAGLASVCILATMVLVMLSSTTSLYFGAEDSLMARYPRELSISYGVEDVEYLSDSSVKELREEILAVLEKENCTPQNVQDWRSLRIFGYLNGTRADFERTDEESQTIYQPDGEIYNFVFVSALDYNALTGENVTLDPGEAAVYTARGPRFPGKEVDFGYGLRYDVAGYLDTPLEDGSIAMDIAPTLVLVVPDLTEAEKCLPLTWTSEYTGRITWGAARSLHARTYMMRNDWDNMYDASTEVIKSGLYNLNTPVDKVFTVEGENCGESVFELQCESTDALKNSDVIGSQFCQVQGVRGAGDWDLGWGWHMGTVLLGGAFEPGDPRKDATLLYFRRSISDPVTPENTNKPYGESPVSTAMGAYFNKKAYTEPELRKKYTKDGFWVNIRIIRYPDVLLMAAEAANEKGIPGEAIDYLEQVRAHARGADSSILPKITSTDQSTLRDAIRHERRVELALEPDRFYDLVRWGIAKEVLQAAGKNYQDKNALLPLPQEEIDKSNGVLKQNPDY